MIQAPVKINRALISVSNKVGIIDFAHQLKKANIEIISTGGTASLLKQENIPVTDISHVTNFPEMMDGRVKTLHPHVHGGILGLRDKHQQIAQQHKINWIDLVIVNLYPFAETIAKPDVTFSEAIENIDIGGPAMIRSAAKNMQWCTVVVDPEDYFHIVTEIQETQMISADTRKKLARKAFEHTANYDAKIFSYLSDNEEELNLSYPHKKNLRYGENPHQSASVYYTNDPKGVLGTKQHQGKELSFNNYLDANAGLECLQEFTEPTAVIIKHTNPCGIASADNIATAFQQALDADAQSAFGGIVALNEECDDNLAMQIIQTFFEIIIAPSYTPKALAIFQNKKNLRVLEYSDLITESQEVKSINGGILVQSKDSYKITAADLQIVTKRSPTLQEIDALLFAWRTVKHVKSNAIVLSKNKTTVSIGAGQVSRIDAVDIALRKAGEKINGCVLASDAFFPFRDSIDRIAGSNVTAIIQPGGSLKDQDVINACDEYNIAMVFTHKRCFKH